MERELEQLLQQMQTEFGKFVKVLSSTNKQIVKNTKTNKEEDETKKRLKRSMYQYLQEVKKGTPLMYEFTEAVDDAQEELTTFEKTLKGMPSPMNLVKKAFNMVKDAAIALGGAIIKTAFNFGKTSSNIKTLEDAVAAGAKDLGKFGVAADIVAKELDDNIEMFRGLAQSGATFGSSILQMRDAATRAGMPLLQFQELIQDNTQVLAKMFGTVNQGVVQFVELGRGLRRFQMEELAGFGITMEEANEFLGTFTELQRAQGRSQGMTAQQLLVGTQSYIKNLTQLSRLTGQSVRELDAQNRQRSLDGVLQAKLAQMSQEDAIKFQKVLDLFPAGAQQAVQELGLLEAPVSDAAKALQVLSGGEIQNIINSAMSTSGKLSEEMTVALSNRIKTLSTDIQQSSLADAFATAALAGGDSFFRQGNDLITAMAGSAGDIAKFTKTTADAQAESPTKALMNVKSALDLNTVALQDATSAILNGLVLDENSAGAKIISGFVADAGKFTQDMVDKLKDFFGVGEGGSDQPPKEPNAFIKWMNKTFSGFGANVDYDGGIGDYMEFNKGSDGFRNFGDGTPAMLHGVEAVVPKNDIGQLSNLLAEVGSSTTTNTTSGDVITNNSTTMDMTRLNANTEQLIALNEKVANHLNTLVMIGSMTEKNTKATNNSLANMGGSLV